ncbi:MAG: hypothetical protein ACLQE9_15175 [Roseiarcus sp.]
MADAFADDLAEAARLDFERSALVLARATARLATLALLADLAAVFFAGRAGLAILASLALADGLDFDGRLAAFDGRLNDFFVAFFRVVMTRLLLELSASRVLLSSRPLRLDPSFIQISAKRDRAASSPLERVSKAKGHDHPPAPRPDDGWSRAIIHSLNLSLAQNAWKIKG